LSYTRYIASLVLILMGSMDCLTTVIGSLYFGTQELNPIVAGLLEANVPAFVFVKLGITIAVGLAFIWAERTLTQTGVIHDRSFKVAYTTLKVASVGIVMFLLIVVVNNVLVLLRTVLA
jgi:hypothetical protein